MPCIHDSFDANVDVIRFTDETDTVTGWTADIRIRCLECREPFVFIGTPAGLDLRWPTVSDDGTDLHAPLRPQSSDPHIGLVRDGHPTAHRDRWVSAPSLSKLGGPWQGCDYGSDAP